MMTDIKSLHERLRQFAVRNGLAVMACGEVENTMLFRFVAPGQRTYDCEVVLNLVENWDKLYETIVREVSENFLAIKEEPHTDEKPETHMNIFGLSREDYLALELTKIRFSTTKNSYGPGEVVESFKAIIRNLKED